MRVYHTSTVREYVFYVFFLKIQKNATFYVFLKLHLKKRKNVIQQILSFCMHSTLYKKLIHVYMYVIKWPL